MNFLHVVKIEIFEATEGGGRSHRGRVVRMRYRSINVPSSG